MQLFVIFMYNISKRRTLPLDDVKDTETVENVKKIILHSTGISVKLQRLIFEGKEMEDGRPLSYYNVKENSTLYLMRGPPGGTKMLLSVNCILKRKMFYLDDVKDIESVKNVKKIIAGVKGIPVEQQRLVFEGKEMEDGRPLTFYNVNEKSTVYLMLGLPGGKKMRLFVNNISKQKTFTLDNVKDTETVENIKKIISDAEDIPVDFIGRIFCEECDEMVDERMLFSYNLLQNNKYMIYLVVYAPHIPLEPGHFCDRRKFEYLARYYNVNKKICRNCYGKLPLNATRCRKAKCGRTDDIRWKKSTWWWSAPLTKPPTEIRIHH